MSQNKTVIQGLESAETVSNQTRSNSNFYARSASNQSYARGTVVPGMEGMSQQQQSFRSVNNSPESNPSSIRQKPVQTGKPIVGFLYSISRTPIGEYWPLQIGRNTIGQNEDCDIRLGEGTISSNHAVIVTRQVKSGVIAAITDAQSTNGTMINGEPIGFSAEECHNGDIITIGNNYQLLLVLIDCGKLGLSVSENFIPVEFEEEENVEDDIPSFDMGRATRPGMDQDSWNNNAPNGTVGLDGSFSGIGHGGTKPI